MIKEQKALSAWILFENLIRRIIKTISPNFGLFDMSYYAKISQVNIASGKVDSKDKRLSANLQILKADLSDDERFEEIRDVPFDSNFFGDSSGSFIAPPVETVVRLGFMYSDPCYPYIISVTNEGQNIPEFDESTFKIVTDSGDTVKIKGGEIELRINNGAAFRLTSTSIEWKGGIYNTTLSEILNQFLLHTHLSTAIGTPTGVISASVPAILPANFQTGTL